MNLRLFFCFLFFPSFVYAQNFLYSEAPIASHTSRKTGSQFILKQKLPDVDGMPKEIRGYEVAVPGYLFEFDLPESAGEYDGLPICEKSAKRYVYRSESEDSFMSLDIFVYKFDDASQKNKAKAFDYKAVPYIEGALSNPYREQGDNEQTIIRVLGVSCLPTRIRSATVDGKKAFEYLEGELSWKQ